MPVQKIQAAICHNIAGYAGRTLSALAVVLTRMVAGHLPLPYLLNLAFFGDNETPIFRQASVTPTLTL